MKIARYVRVKEKLIVILLRLVLCVGEVDVMVKKPYLILDM